MTYRVETYEKTFAGHEPFIAQHRSHGTGILPASVQLEMALLGVAQRRSFTPLELADVSFVRPFTVGDGERVTARLDATIGEPIRFELSAVTPDGRKTISTGSGRTVAAEVRPPAAWTVTCPVPVAPELLYRSWSEASLEYGPDFRTVRALAVGDGTAEATLETVAQPLPWYAHPLLVDGVFQVVSCALQDLTGGAGPRPMLPIGVTRFTLHAQLSRLTAGVTVRVRRTAVRDAWSEADAILLDPAGQVVAELGGVRMRRLPTTAASATPASATTAGTSAASATPASAATADPLLTRIDWHPAGATAGRTPATGTWVVLHPGLPDGVGPAVVRSLRADGARVVEVLPGPTSTPGPDQRIMPEPDEPAFQQLWADIDEPVAGVVHLWNTGQARPETAELRDGLYAVLHAIRTLGQRQRTGRFVVATEHAQPLLPADRPVPARAALWGLVRTAAIEYPGLKPRLVDLDPASAEALAAELTAAGPVETGYRAGVRHEPSRVPLPAFDAGRPPVRPGGRYLILGGHGGLGLVVARRFAAEGAGLVALVSRSGGRNVDPDAVAAIEAYGCRVVSYASDVGVPGALAGTVAQIRERYGDLHGVVHAAGTLKDGLLRSATVEDVAEVLRPKVDGVHALAEAVDGVDLDFAVLFASVSGTFGNLGQGGYAAANAYLDAFAHARGNPWTSVDWGLWGEVGMGTAVAEQLRRRGVRPLGTVEALDAMMTALRDDVRQVVIAHPDASAAPPAPTARGTSSAATGSPPAGRSGTTTTGPATTTGSAVTTGSGDRAGGVDAGRTDDAADAERTADALGAFLAERLDLVDFDPTAPLTDYGINSIVSVELAEELSRRWQATLPATLFLEYGDFAELADALVTRYRAAPPAPEPDAATGPGPEPTGTSEPDTATGPAPEPTNTPESTGTPEPNRMPEPGPLAGPAPEPAGPTAAPVVTTAPSVLPSVAPSVVDRVAPAGSAVERRGDEIAIVAVSGDLPGAGDLTGLWAMLRAGADAFTEIPADRWNIDEHYQRRGPNLTGTYCRTGAFVAGIDRFDPKFFGMAVREAEEMDPQQKLLLEHAWSVVDDSGLTGRRDIGVFVGATYTHHRDANGLDAVGPHTALGSMNAVLANRISYALDLTGPSQTVDTLCSSSLVALQQAVVSLRTGQCGAAIVAACHVGLTPWYYRSLSQLGALSPSRPRPFDDRADGFVPGEGAVAVMLKPLADAERDRDRIWAVVRGAAVNHGGRGSALPVPRSEAQVAVIRAALADAGLDPADISLVETHGTATRLGDPIEIAALAEVFGAAGDRPEPCQLGSVKANLGHLEPASGLAGLVKVLLCLQHGEIPPVAGFERLGAHINLPADLLAIPTAPRPWRSAGPRRAGISAFGMGGTNAHVVVEEYVGTPTAGRAGADRSDGEHLLVLSAHTPDLLARRVADVSRLITEDTPVDLADLCFSAAVGRSHLAYRVAVLATDTDELAAGLRRALDAGPDQLPGLALRGGTVLPDGAPVSRELAEQLALYAPLTVDRIAAELRTPDDRLLTGLALLYVAGRAVDWRRVHDAGRGTRRTLPPYPFRDRTDLPPAARPGGLRGGPGASAEALRPVAPDAEALTRLLDAHRVFGEPTVPAAFLVASGFARSAVLDRLAFTARATGRHQLTSDESAGRAVTFRYADQPVGQLSLGGARPTEPDPLAVDRVRADHPRSIEPAGLYAWFAAKRVDFGPTLRVLTDIGYGPTSVFAGIAVDDRDPGVRVVAALDAAFQAMAVLTLADPTASTLTYLPVSVGRAVRWHDPSGTAYVHLRLTEQDPDGNRRADAVLLDADGRPLVTLTDVVYRPVPAPGTVSGGSGDGAAVARPAARTAVSESAVVALVRGVLRDPEVTATGSLAATGIDSMLATMVAAEIQEQFGAVVSPVEILQARDCRELTGLVASLAPEVTSPGSGVTSPEVTAVASEVASAVPGDEPGGPEQPATPAGPVPVAVTDPVRTPSGTGRTGDADGGGADRQDMAVIGVACALPGATDPTGFWSLLTEGGNGIGPAPTFRWAGATAAGDAVGGFLDRIDEFDARFFDFFAKQAEVLDPQVRWLMRTAWEALESAGIPPLATPSSTGVFVGASYQHYRDYNIPPELDAPSGLGNHNAFLANRVSYFLDLVGPSMTIDTLCSSSLVALHTAVRSIRNGECDQAIVAGVRLALSPLHYVAMNSLRALSPTGASRAFDAGADGFVPGEGVVTVVVKPLVDAVRDGDRIRGVIRGSAVNHGGRTSGLTVPSSAAQSEVIVAALRDAGVSPDSIGMVEAHGTGTSLGDPIEVDGLSRAWRSFTSRTQFCAIGSLKSNIGHLEPAAGLAGVVKVLLALEGERIPPTLHVVRPNDHIRFEGSPFFVADRVVPWRRVVGVPRRAAVSAFGMGGVNAHVIVEEAPLPAERGPVSQDSHIVRVSAASEDAVRRLAGAYADVFAAATDPWHTADLCHTANTGRSPFGHQTAVTGADGPALAEQLRAVAAGRVPVGRVDDTLTTPVPTGGTGSTTDWHAALAELVRQGHPGVDWAALSVPGARVVELPTYPFDRSRYWHTRTPATASAAVLPPSDVEPPQAWRTGWQLAEPLPAASAYGITVRVVAADRATGGAVTATLSARGVDIVADDKSARGLVVVAAATGRPDDDTDLAGFWEQLRDLLAALPSQARVVWVEQHSAAVDAADRARLDAAAAARVLAVRAAAAENRLAVVALDLDPTDPVETRARQIAAEFAALRPGTNDVVAYRKGSRYVPEQLPARPGTPVDLTGDGYHLVTGGLGAIGRRLVAHLIAAGARRVGIVGRSPVDPATDPVLRELGTLAEVDYRSCDVADQAALTAAATAFGRRWGRLRGVVHCSGGVNPFGSLRRRPWAEAARVTAPKVAGSRNVLDLARAEGAGWVTLVSSIAGALPHAGRGLVDYALANAYQLALAEQAGPDGPTVTAHAWPNWTGIGMEADASVSAGHSLGLAQALSGFGTHLLSGGAVVFPGAAAPEQPVAPVPGEQPSTPASRERPMVPVVAEQPAATAAPGHRPAAPAADLTGPARRGVDLTGPARPAVEPAGPAGAEPVPAGALAAGTDPLAVVRSAFVDVLGEDPGLVPLPDLGLDSLVIADLTNAIERRGGITVDPSVVMRARTMADIAAWLGNASAGTPATARSGATPAEAVPSSEATRSTAAPTATLSALLRPLLVQHGPGGQ
ncbi:SDR family NAD(P)-dependent oxidoreductase [Micromonospora cathayae]|uniref:SDR family NAD(P)-dependent oxidoreductase n=1 Tax=Micromonospora cathayae TaxID=3028804 RepID=A0ABY7ZL12_9ACTN|nr:SDR family NAD(P)-dependent oxidoreductase [Micromonospora sp. HUAS 3]WDZ83563.1 SDR family NAD(P)-dependent oxidoreductase [Micromonospora sp. HUAS 3]